jgi:ABC-type amino acid transport system permease subunit
LRYGRVFSAGVVLAINAGAYMSEIVRAGIEASRSLGLNYFQTMRKVVLPQAIRTMLPSVVNQFIISRRYPI